MRILSLLGTAVAIVSTTTAYAQNVSPAARVYLPPNPASPSIYCPSRFEPTKARSTSELNCAADSGQQFNVGQLIPASLGEPIGFAQLTPALRSQYSFNPDNDFVLVNGYLYDLDHATRKVRRVIPVTLAR